MRIILIAKYWIQEMYWRAYRLYLLTILYITDIY